MKTQITSGRAVALGTLGVMTLGSTVLLSGPAQAGPSTWKKVAIGGAAVTGYGLIKGKGRVATVGAVTTGASYYMYKRSKKKQEAQRRAWYQQRYGRNWRSHYYAKR